MTSTDRRGRCACSETAPRSMIGSTLITLLILPMFSMFAQRLEAQSLTMGVDLLFYGDNTEFANPFRDGETLLGTSGRVFIDLALSDAATLRAGLFAQGRYGAHEFVEQIEPVIALELKRGTSRFLFGSLDTSATRPGRRGPEQDTPHGLLPPIEREQLTFARAHEMGLQWRVEAPRLDHDLWIDWQRLNTPEHRERFDTGVRTRVGLSPAVALHGQWHLVHEGGQQFANGPVRDSHAGALGVEWSQTSAAARLVLDGHAVVTREVPDRDEPHRSETGAGVFARGALEHAGWRGHLVVWRSRDTLKEEGDENYLTLRRDGTKFRKVRDYAELGITRYFQPAPTVQFNASARLHRVESHYEYSYRLVARVFLRYGR